MLYCAFWRRLVAIRPVLIGSRAGQSIRWIDLALCRRRLTLALNLGHDDHHRGAAPILSRRSNLDNVHLIRRMRQLNGHGRFFTYDMAKAITIPTLLSTTERSPPLSSNCRPVRTLLAKSRKDRDRCEFAHRSMGKSGRLRSGSAGFYGEALAPAPPACRLLALFGRGAMSGLSLQFAS
jgi:hypothetical protein